MNNVQVDRVGTSVTPAPVIQLATALQGAQPFKFKNVADTYIAPLLLPDQSQRLSYLKDLPAKELANELMAAAIASVVGLPCPRAYLVKVSPTVLPLTKGPTLGTDRFAFATVDAQMPSIMQLVTPDLSQAPAIIARFLQWPSVGLLYGFDSFVANIDRNSGNLLLGTGNDVLAIDHGRCFTGPQWDSSNLKPAEIYEDRLKQWLTPNLDQPARKACLTEAVGVPSLLGNDTLSDIGNANFVGNFLSASDFAALVQFLDDRRAHVPTIAADALGNPP